MNEKYFIAKITTDVLDEISGKLKKIKEEKLVKAFSPTDVESKVTKVYENYSMEWRITSISESKIDEVLN